VAAVLTGLVVIAAGILLGLQWGNDCEFSLFGKSMEMNTALALLLAIVFGVMLPFLLRLLWVSFKTINRARQFSTSVQRAADKAAAQTPAASQDSAS
jgi:hypothetical protein